MDKKIVFIWILLGIALGIFLQKFISPSQNEQFNYKQFGELPIQQGGRVKSIDTLARSALIQLSGKQSLRLPDKKGKISAAVWFCELIMRPEIAHNYPVFRIDSAELLAFLGWSRDKRTVSFNELTPYLEVIAKKNVDLSAQKEEKPTEFEAHFKILYNNLTLYNELLATFQVGTSPDNLESEYVFWLANIDSGLSGIRHQLSGTLETLDSIEPFLSMADKYLTISKLTKIGFIPSDSQWLSLPQGFLEQLKNPTLNLYILNYIEAVRFYRIFDYERFNETLDNLNKLYRDNTSIPLKKVYLENYFNKLEIFYTTCLIYFLCFLGIIYTWLFRVKGGLRLVGYLFLFAFLLHTTGILMRMIVQGRPPVTNLYASAVFIGWASVLFSFVLERFFRHGFALFVGSLIGGGTLIIAHHLSLAGDTLDPVQAVLNSNFWLSTHVTTITLGYAAVFFAGTLGLVYVFCGLWNTKFPQGRLAQDLNKMGYAAIAFGLVFSFIGTLLGGIWADQSWGRFWGWDPKENGALMIVLWCAVVLHARLGKLLNKSHFMLLLILGNIVTSWSWFGTNMLSVGMHSYGFIEQFFWPLILFMLTQVAAVLLGYWRIVR